jgi:hypothetical protein
VIAKVLVQEEDESRSLISYPTTQVGVFRFALHSGFYGILSRHVFAQKVLANGVGEDMY